MLRTINQAPNPTPLGRDWEMFLDIFTAFKAREEAMLPEFFRMERIVTLLGAISQLGGFGSLPTKDGKIDLGGLGSNVDEGRYRQLIKDLAKKFNVPPNPTRGTEMAEALVGLYWFILPREWYLKPIEAIGGNQLRKFILGLEVIPGKPAVAEKRNARNEVIVPASAAVEGRDCRMEMLTEWADIILSETDRTEGYRKLVRVLRDNKLPAGLPLPEGWQDEVSTFFMRHAQTVTEIPPALQGPRYWGFVLGLPIIGLVIATKHWWWLLGITVAILVIIAGLHHRRNRRN